MPSAEQDMLQAWVAERALDGALAAGDAPDSPAPEPGRQTVLDEPALALGQIRLLTPALAPGPTPRYVSVCDTHMGTVILVPFGRYALPALPGEYATSLMSPPLRVACLWNAIEVDAQRTAQNSWFAGTLDATIAARLSRALEWFHTGDPTLHQEVGVTGPRLIHPQDPRHEYIQEERRLSHAIRRDCGALQAAPPALYLRPLTDPADRVAAESQTSYGRFQRAAIAGTVLWLKWDSVSGQDQVRIEDPNGGLSQHFDGCWLQNPDGDCSSPAWNGKLQVPAPLMETATHMVRPEGTTLRLLRTR